MTIDKGINHNFDSSKDHPMTIIITEIIGAIK